MSLTADELLLTLNEFADQSPFYEVVDLGNNTYRCFVEDGHHRKELLYEASSFEQNGIYIDIISVGFTASDSLIRYFDLYAERLDC